MKIKDYIIIGLLIIIFIFIITKKNPVIKQEHKSNNNYFIIQKDGRIEEYKENIEIKNEYVDSIHRDSVYVELTDWIDSRIRLNK